MKFLLFKNKTIFVKLNDRAKLFSLAVDWWNESSNGGDLRFQKYTDSVCVLAEITEGVAV